MRCPRFTLAQARRVMRLVKLPKGITPQQLLVGMNVEREHAPFVGCSPLAMAKIAAPHIRERRDYYPLLKRYVEG